MTMIEISTIKITDIKPAEYNPRIMSQLEHTKLRNSMETFGVVDPIIINLKNNHIIGGHQGTRSFWTSQWRTTSS